MLSHSLRNNRQLGRDVIDSLPLLSWETKQEIKRWLIDHVGTKLKQDVPTREPWEGMRLLLSDKMSNLAIHTSHAIIFGEPDSPICSPGNANRQTGG